MPAISKRVLANLTWTSRNPLRVNNPYLVKHATETLCGCITRVGAGIEDSDPLRYTPPDGNGVATVELETHRPMICDPYTSNPDTGRFLMIDPADNTMLGRGIILETSLTRNPPNVAGSPEVPPNPMAHPQRDGVAVWFTGLSGSGKTTICRSVHAVLLARGIGAQVLDADDLRKNLNRDLGFSKEDRDENIRRIGFVAHLITRKGLVALVAAISPYRSIREEVRITIGDFLEVYVDAPLSVCESRDPKGLYKKARAGEIRSFTGIDDPYEPPLSPEIHCATDRESPKMSADKVVSGILKILSPDRV
jgi:adenylyl-sulfate kinase